MTHSAWLRLRLETMVDLILAHPSRPLLVVAQILPIAKGNSLYQANNDNCCERIKEWNGYWATKVAAVGAANKGRIALVDFYSPCEAKRGYGAVPGTSLWGEATAQQGDWVHPGNADGGAYSLMASGFTEGIDSLLSASQAPSSSR